MIAPPLNASVMRLNSVISFFALLVAALPMPVVYGGDAQMDAAPKCGSDVHGIDVVDLFDAYNGSKCHVPLSSASLIVAVLVGANGKVTRFELISAEVDPPAAKECLVQLSAVAMFYAHFSHPASECRKEVKLTLKPYEGA